MAVLPVDPERALALLDDVVLLATGANSRHGLATAEFYRGLVLFTRRRTRTPPTALRQALIGYHEQGNRRGMLNVLSGRDRSRRPYRATRDRRRTARRPPRSPRRLRRSRLGTRAPRRADHRRTPPPTREPRLRSSTRPSARHRSHHRPRARHPQRDRHRRAGVDCRFPCQQRPTRRQNMSRIVTAATAADLEHSPDAETAGFGFRRGLKEATN